MTDLIYALYDECLQAGMMPEQFWNCTHYDIIAYLQAKNRAKRLELKEQSRMLYNISLSIGSFVNGKKIPYNTLFPQLKDTEPAIQDWRTQKEIVMRFAEKYNLKKKMEREARNDARGIERQDNRSE